MSIVEVRFNLVMLTLIRQCGVDTMTWFNCFNIVCLHSITASFDFYPIPTHQVINYSRDGHPLRYRAHHSAAERRILYIRLYLRGGRGTANSKGKTESISVTLLTFNLVVFNRTEAIEPKIWPVVSSSRADLR